LSPKPPKRQLIGTIANLLREEAEQVKSTGSIEAEPDPGDTPFWECAEHGRADFIVTLNPKDFPQSKLKATVILPSEPVPSGICPSRDVRSSPKTAPTITVYITQLNR